MEEEKDKCDITGDRGQGDSGALRGEKKELNIQAVESTAMKL